MIKFEHSIFALPFAYLGLVLAEGGLPRLEVFAGVTLAMVSCRTLGMALNRIIDARIDAMNPRTAGRAIPAGLLKTSFVWAVSAVSLVVFIVTCKFLGSLCLALAPIPIFLSFLYPFAKRFTWFSHGLLGMILGIAPYGAWIASRGDFSWIPALLSLGILFWVAGFDMIYALQDQEFDRKHGLYSFPARFGQPRTLQVTKVFHVLTLAAWIAAGEAAGLGWIYRAGMILTAFFLIREHWLIGRFGLEKIQEAFFKMNAVVSVTVFALTVLDLAVKGVRT